MSWHELDHYCRFILSILMSEINEANFNTLARIAKDLVGFSRPTLSKHLKHLVQAGFIIKRRDESSKLPLKPTYYSVNYEALYTHAGEINPSLSRLKGLNSLIEKKDFKNLAWELLRFIYFGDLVQTRLFIESLKKESESKKTLVIARGLMCSLLDALTFTIYKISKTAKDQDIDKILNEFDTQIKRSTKFFQTGKLD